MSEETHVERGISLEEVPNIGAQYLEASDEEPEHQVRLDEIEAKINELRSTRKEIAEEVGEDHYLVEDIDADIEDFEDEREELQKSTQDVAQLREDILRGAAEDPGFRLNKHWLNSEAIRALTHALYGTKAEKLVIADQEFRTPDDVQGLDRMQKIQIKREIVHLTRDQLGGDERVAERWEEFKDSRSHQAFPVIASEPGVGPSEIAEAYDDKTPSAVRNWTSELSDQDDLKMVYTPKQGNYHLSTAGSYYAAQYADLDEADDTEESDEDVEADSGEGSPNESGEVTDEDEDDSGQVNLGNSDETLVNQSQGSTDTKRNENLTEVETTDEKAEVLFDDVSENRRTTE